MHVQILYALMLMTCYTGKTCKSVAVQTYPTKEDCQHVSTAIRNADDTIMATCTQVTVTGP